MLRSFLLILFMLVLSSSKAQNGSITGKIRTSDNYPAEFVNIGLKGTSKAARVNTQGNYEITDIEPGTYTLSTSFMGLETREVIIDIQPGRTVEVPEIVLQESLQQLQEVVVTSNKSNNEKPVSIGKTNIKPMDLPQSIAIIDKVVLEQQQSLYMSDVLKNVNGVYLMGNTGGTQEEIAGRGFAFNSNNTFKNGVRFNNSAMPEMSALETVEVMKGSSAILFGNVAAGGIINLVTKKPLFQTGAEVKMRIGSYDLYKPSIDVYGALNNKHTAAFRVNTSYEKSRSFRDVVNVDRMYINPSLLFKPFKKLEILIEGDYLRDNRTNDYGVAAVNYALTDIPINRFLGAAWSYNKTEQKSLSSTITYYVNNSWQLRAVASYQNYINDLFGTTRPNASGQFVRTNGNWIRGLQRTSKDENYYLGQLDLTGKFSTGFLKHQVLIGADADQYFTTTIAYKGLTVYDSINVFDLNKYKQRNDIPDLQYNTTTTSPTNRAGAYIQDLISITGKIKLLMGVRASYIETFSNVYTHATDTYTASKLFDHAYTPRLGLVYQPLKSMSVFCSYANAFSLNTGVDVNGNVLKPSYIDQYELGVKNDFFKGLLSVNVTAYQIKNSNLAQTSLANGNTNANIKELGGEVTSTGGELDIMSKPYKGISFIGGYSYNDTRYTKSNTYITGSRLLYNPAHTANASLYYSFSQDTKLRGFNLGAGMFYVGKREAGRLTRTTVLNDSYKPFALPDYMLLDASIGYVKNKFSIRIKMSNILDTRSYNVHDDNSVNPIAPRQVAATIGYKF